MVGQAAALYVNIFHMKLKFNPKKCAKMKKSGSRAQIAEPTNRTAI